MGKMDKPTNLYDRHRNKRAQAKKERAKAGRANSNEDEQGILAWRDFEYPEAGDSNVGIISEVRGGISIVLLDEKMVECKLDRKIPFALFRELVVGDKVHVESRGGEAWIVGRVPRASYLARMRGDSTRFSAHATEEQVVAVNIDVAAIVASSDRPAFHSGLIDRYLISCENGCVRPIICLNKADLTDTRDPILRWYQDQLGITVIETSAETGQGLETLSACLRGRIAVLVGNSGVGKSSIINRLMPGLSLAAKTVSERSGEGRHTTTASNLYPLEGGTLLIDTPGIRNLAITDIPRSGLKTYFPEFAPFERACKFNNCLHDHEPQCGVKNGVESGEISRQRYESYLRMLKNLND